MNKQHAPQHPRPHNPYGSKPSFDRNHCPPGKKEIKHQYKMMGTGTTANGDWMNM
jgi:hypothetical protein